MSEGLKVPTVGMSTPSYITKASLDDTDCGRRAGPCHVEKTAAI